MSDFLLNGTDRSGTITAAGVAQTIAPALASRHALRIQNISGTDLWVNTLGTAVIATPGSFLILNNLFYDVLGTGAVSIVGATLGQKFTAVEN